MPASAPPPPRARTHAAAPRSLLAIAAVALVAITAIWAIAIERVRFERARAIETEGMRNDNLALAHEERTARLIEVFDQLLLGVRRDLRTRGAPRDLAGRLADAGSSASRVTALTVIGPDGHVVATNLDPPPTLNYADRSYFEHHAVEPADSLHVAVPVVGKQSGRWVVPLSRRVEAPGGGFGGVVLVTVEADFLATLYERSGIGANGSLALIGLDGITRVRRNGERTSFGDDVRTSRLFAEITRAPAGRYRAKAASDGVERLVSYRRMAEHPLAIVVASSVDDVLAATADRERTTWSGAALATLLVAALAAALMHGRRRSARELATAEARERRYRLLFENSFDAILRTRPDGRVLAANAAACALFGLDEAQLRASGREQLVDVSDPRLRALLAERAATGRAQGLLRMRRGDGSLFEAEISSNVYADDDGLPATSMIVRDLTQRQASEAERARLEARLREAQKLESIGTLAGGIAHDFNNILAAILGNAAMLADDLGPEHAGAEPLARIRQGAMRGRALVQKILTFSRRKPEQREPVVMQRALDEAIALLRATLPATVELELRIAAEPLVVVADATQLQQVLLNLCTNAWQALPGQKGRVQVTLERVERGACSPHDGPSARLRVQDDGVGMDEATRARLFEPFFTTKPVGQGTGLGLSVVHGIVVAHGGAIGVQSAPGAGTTFDVCLPLTEQVPVPLPAATPTAPAAIGRGEHVLYVDDDEVMTLTVDALLKRAGFRVTTYARAADALAAIEADPQGFDVLVTDFNMPGLSGLELVAALRRLRPDLPAIVSSGYVSDTLHEQARALGVHAVLLKAYTLERLADLLREALSAARPTAA